MNPIWFNQIRVPLQYEDEGIVASIPESGPALTLYSGNEYCGMEVWDDTYSAQDVKRLKAKRFVDLIMSGKTPTKAAEEINVQLASYQTKEEVQKAIKSCVEQYHFSPEIRKMYSRALNMKIALEQGSNPDPKAAKVALEALKIMAQDDEVGWLNQKNQPNPPNNAQLPEALTKLIGVGKEETEVTDVEE